MSIRRFLAAAVTASGLFLGAVTAPAASAYNVQITEGICAITFDEQDEKQVQSGLESVLLESYWALQRDIPTSDVRDIAAVTNYVFPNWGESDFATAWDFRGTRINGIAHRLNNAAQRAGFRDNEIFEIVRFQYLMSLDVVTEVDQMRGTKLRPESEPLLITTGRAATLVQELRLINLAPRGQFSAAGQRTIDLLASKGYQVLEKAYEPIIRCAGGDGGPGGRGGGAAGSSLSS